MKKKWKSFLTSTGDSIAAVARVTGTGKTASSVGTGGIRAAVGGAILTLIFICKNEVDLSKPIST